MQEAEAALKEKYGKNFEGVANRAREAVRRIDQANGNNHLVQALDETGLGNHPAVIEAFAAVSRLLEEPARKDGDQPGGRFGLDPVAAREKANAIIGNKSDLYYQQPSAAQRARVEEVQRLLAIANGEN